MALATPENIREAIKKEGLPLAHLRPTTKNGWWRGRWTRGLQVLTGCAALRGRWNAAAKTKIVEALNKHFLVERDEDGFTLRVKEA